MNQSDAITLYGPEQKNNDEICNLCEAGCPRCMLARIKASGFDCEILKKKVMVREASPIPVHPGRQPFLTACAKRNYPIVRLFLELGADPDAECRAWNNNLKTPRQNYTDNLELQELFEGGKSWWKVEYPEEKKMTLRDELEHFIMAGKASEAVWLMMHGVRLDSPAMLASEAFAKQSQAFKELVCGMGVSNDRLQEFQDWLNENATDALNIMEMLARTGGDEGREFVEKLLLSIDLIGAGRLDSLIGQSIPIPVQIGILRCFISAYDASEHKPFVEKAITTLFKEMLCASMEV